jgi:hypothetical protein
MLVVRLLLGVFEYVTHLEHVRRFLCRILTILRVVQGRLLPRCCLLVHVLVHA